MPILKHLMLANLLFQCRLKCPMKQFKMVSLPVDGRIEKERKKLDTRKGKFCSSFVGVKAEL